MNRLGIFFFYDKEGVVDDYISHLLKNVVPFLKKLVVVCNGEINQDGKMRFKDFTSNIILRENTGLDVGAYKCAIESLGWNEIRMYDEMIIFNHTIMGPVYPFNEMFDTMEKKDVDFWGITKYGKESFDPFGYSPYGYLPEHIQSHFMVFRKSLTSNDKFKKFWENLPETNSYNESIGLFESVFTKKFEDEGFTWDVYVNTDDYEGITTYPLMNYPKQLIQKKRCPIFKRRTFFQPYTYVLGNTVGQAAFELMDYLKKSNLYDINLIWDNILRTCHQADFVKNMQLQYVLPSNMAPIEKVDRQLAKTKVALVMHLYFEDLIESSFEYARTMPSSTDVYITTNTEKKKKSIEKKFSELKCHKIDVRVIMNRGRDVSSVLVGVKDVIMDYDIVCFAHDKKTAQINPGSVGEGFAYKCFENTLHNKEFVYNVIHTFLENPRLGIMSPPVPNHGDFFPTLGLEWSVNFDNTKKLAQELNITVPMAPEKEPVAPLGTFFWFRPSALKPLYDHNWSYDEFPEEPNGIDGTLLHAVERLYPFAAQQAGYYPARVMSDTYARIEINNLEYYVREYNRVLLDHHMGGYQHVMVDRLCQALDDRKELLQTHEHVCNEWKATAELLKQLEDSHKFVCEEWRKTADVLKQTEDELNNVKIAYNNVIHSYGWRIISKITYLIDKLRGKR